MKKLYSMYRTKQESKRTSAVDRKVDYRPVACMVTSAQATENVIKRKVMMLLSAVLLKASASLISEKTVSARQPHLWTDPISYTSMFIASFFYSPPD